MACEDRELFLTFHVNLGVIIANRSNRGVQLDQAGALPEHLAPARLRQTERPPVEQASRVQHQPNRYYQDAFETAMERMRAEFDAAHKRQPGQTNAIDRLLTSKEFQERLKETVAGTSPRAQQVKQVESAYKAFWKDSQDFSVSGAARSNQPKLNVPEPPRFIAPAETAWRGRALTVPDFKAVTDVSDRARVQAAEQATNAGLMAQRAAAVTEQRFSLVGLAEVRG
jgi:hypothetical protein